jgi:hypothetical protein
MAEKAKEMGSSADGMKTPISSAISDITTIWNSEIRSDSTPITWIWTSYETNTYVVVAKGNSLENFLQVPKPDIILFGGIRIEKPIPKFVHVLWIGSTVSALKKGKAQLHKSAAFNAMEGATGEISCSSPENIIDDIKKLLKLSDIVVE